MEYDPLDLPAENLIGYWKAMVGRIDNQSYSSWVTYLKIKLRHLSETEIRTAIDEIAFKKTDNFKTPNLADLKHGLGSDQKHAFKSSVCQCCFGHALVVMFNIVDGQRLLVDPNKPHKNKGLFYTTVVPCTCQDGNSLTWEQFRPFVLGVVSPNDDAIDGYTIAKRVLERIRKQGEEDDRNNT